MRSAETSIDAARIRADAIRRALPRRVGRGRWLSNSARRMRALALRAAEARDWAERAIMLAQLPPRLQAIAGADLAPVIA